MTSIVLIAISCSDVNKSDNHIQDNVTISPTNKVVLSSEIEWEKLNPARGDKSPQAGTIWGDRKGAVATGFLAKFVDGFCHLHIYIM